MEDLFKLSPEELSKVCVEAEFDENHQLVFKPENCIQEDNITFLKQPIRVRYGTLQTSILGKTAIVKEAINCSFLYLFAVAETKKYRETLRNFYETNCCDQYDCSGLDGYYEGWHEDRDFHVLEVQDEDM